MIRVKLIMSNLLMSSIYHVIDTKTYYKLLLGQLGLHKHGIVASTLHQCLKTLLRWKKEDKQQCQAIH